MTPAQPTRRNFLKGSLRSPDYTLMRPPRAVDAFPTLCDGCTKCETACPENIIVMGKDRQPVIDFTHGLCTFCSECANACPTGALDPLLDLDWNWKPAISQTCFSQIGVTCRSCEDVCDQNVIRFKLRLGGRSEPQIDFDSCSGCGACAHVCPANAVTFKLSQPEMSEAIT